MDDEMTPQEVAQELRVSASTVRRWEAVGVLVPSRRFPTSGHRRYLRADVEELKTRMQVKDSGGAEQQL